MLVGCAIGLINGLLVTFARISPIITTIATWQLLLGFSLWYTNGLPKRNFDSDYGWLGRSKILFLATPTVLAILVVVAGVAPPEPHELRPLHVRRRGQRRGVAAVRASGSAAC